MKSLFAFLLTAVSFQLSAVSLCTAPWYCRIEERTVTIHSIYKEQVAIRSGFLKESDEVPFRGNIIYYQGLGDSMMNHAPLFNKLTAAGYRVIAFDYMGQGGSQGDMDNTRIEAIPRLGNDVWNEYARDLKNFPKKTIIGWSTGGLAAYLQAASGDVSNVVLIAPGLVPNIFVGETNLLYGKINAITLRSLTNDIYSEAHVEPIVPSTPLKVLNFVSDLMRAANFVRYVSIPSRVRGLVLLSGKSDSYVDAEKTRRILHGPAPKTVGNASHFDVKSYPNALHEIDNEVKEIRDKAHKDILEFLDKNTP